MIRVIALDFDGVVLESVSVKDNAVFNLFPGTTLQQRERVLEVHRKNPGISRPERINLLLTRGLGRRPAKGEVDRLLERFSALVQEEILACPEVPGIRDFLASIKPVPCYIVSAAPSDEVRAAAEARGLSGYFADIFGTPPSKDKTLSEIAGREKAEPGEILFIGDRLPDYQAAKKAGVLFAGRRSPENPAEFPAGVAAVDDFVDGGEKLRRIFLQNPKESNQPAD